MDLTGSSGLTGQAGGMFGYNQYGSYPTLQNTATAGGANTPYGAGGFGTPTGGMTQATPSAGSYTQPYSGYWPGGTVGSSPGQTAIGGGYMAGSTYNPVLTNALFSYLNSQVGQGLPQYPGQLTAPPNVNLQDLSNFLAGGQSNIPGMSQLAGYAQTGNPISALPEWQAMLGAEQQNIQQQAANLRESMSAGGNLVGTPYGTTMQDFYNQALAQQNAQLTAAQTQLSSQAQQNQLGAINQIMGQVLPTSQQLQGVQQAGLTNAYQAWLQSLPQYNPTLGYQMAAGTTFPSYMQKAPSTLAQTLGAVGGGLLGGVLGGLSSPSASSQAAGMLGSVGIGGGW